MSGVHDARCEREYTENGFIFIDCLCSLRKAKAEAWDEGHDAGYGDAVFDDRGFPDDDDASDYPHKNPYRMEATA